MKSALSITHVFSCWQLESRRPGFKLTWYFGQEVPPCHVIKRGCACARVRGLTTVPTAIMSTKHVFDDPHGLVEKACRGVASTNSNLRFYAPHKVLYNAAHPRDKVAIIAGGGAGHEPSFSALTGEGLVTVSVSGDVFASPSSAQICSGVDLAPTDKGIVVLVLNYTGDCLNFGLAAEKARSAFAGEGKGREVEMVIVGDDVSVGRSKGGLVGRRGLTGAAFTAKVIGAAAEKGDDVKKVAGLGRSMVNNFVTVGLSLDHCHVPGRSTDPEERGALSQSAIEIGMGIHNETGAKHIENKPSAEDLIKEMLEMLLRDDDPERSFVKFNKDDEPVMIINNLGGMSCLELSAIAAEARVQLERDWNMRPSRVHVGTYVTSLNAPGFNISLLNHKRVSQEYGSDVLELIDAPTGATGWMGAQIGMKNKAALPTAQEQEEEPAKILEQKAKEGHAVGAKPSENKAASVGPKNGDAELVKKVIENVCKSVIDVEPIMTKYDTVVGDGDAGETLRHCAEGVMKALESNQIPLDRATATVLGITEAQESNMGGTSGALYAIYLTGLVQGLQKSTNDPNETASVKHWASAAEHARESLSRYTPARPGDRTLVDALDPFCRTLLKEAESGKNAKDALQAAVSAAKEGAEKTRDLTARLGRATYVGETSEKVPDPGAWGIWALVEGILKSM